VTRLTSITYVLVTTDGHVLTSDQVVIYQSIMYVLVTTDGHVLTSDQIVIYHVRTSDYRWTRVDQ